MASMNDRDRGRGAGRRPARSNVRPAEPALPDDVTASDLDPQVRRDLLTLDKANADRVARHLVMVTRLLDEDPVLALDHARAARERAGRVGLVRETAGIAAYSAGEWQEALTELRAARRISGGTALLPLIADAERGLGRPERAIEIARSEDGRALSGEEATEMRIVEAGARIDLGEPEKAIVTLQAEDLSPSRTGTPAARLFYAYASALLAAGRRDDAVTWYMNAAAADVDDATDAEFALMELSAGDEGDGETEDHRAVSSPAVEESAATESAAEESAVEESSVEESAGDTSSAAAAVGEVSKPQSPPSATLAAGYQALLLDLDGTVFSGHRPVDGAAETLDSLDIPQLFVTNNASRRPDAVAAHLTELGFTATPEQVVTSAQSAARLLAEHLAPGSRALVLGTDGLAQEVREVGIGVTRSADDRPAAVIQGFSPDTGWAQLSEAALAIRGGALWIATNVDATLPSERGQMVGNGSLVAAVANATGAQPLVAGKPAAPLMSDAIARSGVASPLVVGDRLDTDIQGAHAVGLDSALVLTGVSSAKDLLVAPPEQRPTYVIDDLTGLLEAADLVRVAAQEQWQVSMSGTTVTVAATGDVDSARSSLLPALADAVWRLIDGQDLDSDAVDPTSVTITSDDDAVRSLLETLGVGTLD